VQAEILELLRQQVDRLGSGMVFITHDFGCVAALCDRVAVMYAGRIVELGDAMTMFARPAHPYTRGLLATVPRIDDAGEGDLESIPGGPPTPGALPSGCAFEPRCAWAVERCRLEDVQLRRVDGERQAACHRAEEVVGGGAP
jgi:oligopeptide transport system ATP-binding protein